MITFPCLIIDKLSEILEYYLIFQKDYYPIDTELAYAFNKREMETRIRFASDNAIINERLYNITHNNLLKSIWDLAEYETQCKFITEYIENIKVNIIEKERTPRIRKKKGTIQSNTQNKMKYGLELIELNFKQHKINELLEFKNKNMLDEMFIKNKMSYTHSTFKSEREALDYINLLRKKHNFIVIDKDLIDEEIKKISIPLKSKSLIDGTIQERPLADEVLEKLKYYSDISNFKDELLSKTSNTSITNNEKANKPLKSKSLIDKTLKERPVNNTTSDLKEELIFKIIDIVPDVNTKITENAVPKTLFLRINYDEDLKKYEYIYKNKKIIKN